VSHEHVWARLPDLLEDRDEPELLAHLASCHDCQRQAFLLGRLDRLLRDAAPGQRPQRRRARKASRFGVPAGLVAVAAVALLVLSVPHGHSSGQFTFRTASGQPIGEAVLTRADAENGSLSLVARGLAAHPGGTYVLWAASDGGAATTVGRFMVDASGSCRARFNLPGKRSWARFWVTLQGKPRTVIATT